MSSSVVTDMSPCIRGQKLIAALQEQASSSDKPGCDQQSSLLYLAELQQPSLHALHHAI